MQRVTASYVIINFYSPDYQPGPFHRHEFKTGRLTRSFNEALVILAREQRIRQISEELLKEPGNAVHIMEKICRVAEINLIRV